jgi:hypothetical protein
VLNRITEAWDPTRVETSTYESVPLVIDWRSLQGFCADETDLVPDGQRLQALDVVCDDGALNLLAPAASVSVFFSAVGRWAGQWRMARSRLGLVLGHRRRAIRSVA